MHLWVAAADSSRHDRLLQHVQTLTADNHNDAKVPRSIDRRPLNQRFSSSSWIFNYYLYNLYSLQETGQKVLDNVSFDVKQGELLTVIGPVGAGKVKFINAFSSRLTFVELVTCYYKDNIMVRYIITEMD